MSDDQLDDLKQYIDSRFSQSEALTDEKLNEFRNEMREGFVAVNNKMDDGFAGVGEAFDELHTQIDKTNLIVDQRLTKLEQRAA